MAEAPVNQTPSLSEDYLLEKNDNQDTGAKLVEVKEVAAPAPVEEPVPVPAKELPVEEKTTDAATEENTEASAKASAETPVTAEESTEAPSAAEDNNDEKSDEQEEAAEETPEIKIETVPADFRFPTTNQTRHCFTRYVEYHRCVAAKGEGAPECDKFAKYYRSLCPSEWIERWNEQRENGTFPGPL